MPCSAAPALISRVPLCARAPVVQVTWQAAGSFAVKASAPLTAVITSIAQNFAPADESQAALAGHITVTSAAATGTRFAVDITDFVSGCSGGSASLTVARRFRNNAYSGNAAGPIAADSLSGGAVVQFHSKEAADTGARPLLRLLQTPVPAAKK